MKPKSTLRSFLLIAGSALLAISHVHAADATWNVNADGNWVDDLNWNPAAPGAISGTTNADVATFGNVITAAKAITVDASRNISGINFNANSSAYTLSGGNLLLTNGGTIQTSGAGSAHTDVVSSPIAIQGDGGAASITAGSSTATRLLSISGDITGVSTGSNVTTLTLGGSNTGGNGVGGLIGDGSGGGKLALVKSGAGVWSLTNSSNSFSGGISISGGQLRIGADGGLGNTSNGITFSNASALLTTVNNVSVPATRTLTVNTGAIAILGDSNFNANPVTVTIDGKVTGDGGIQVGHYQLGTGVMNLNNTGHDFKGSVTIGVLSVYGGFTYATATLNIGSLADASGYGNIVFGRGNAVAGQTANFQWSASAVAPLVLNNRQLQLDATIESAALRNNNASTSNTITVNTDLLVSRAGNKPFILGGSNTGNNTFAGLISNSTSPAATISLTKADGGKWILSNSANTYTGITTVSAGTLEVAKLDIGGNNSSIGASSNAATNLVFNTGGILRYVGTGDSTDRAFTFGSNANNVGFTLDASGTGALSYTSTVAITNTQTGTNQIRFYTLTGTNTGDNTLAATVTNNGANAANVTKSGIGKWVLTGTNTHTGATFTNFGTLELKDAGAGHSQTLGAMNFNQSQGTLVSNNTGSGTLSTTFVSAGRANGGTGNIIIQGGTNGVDNLINVTGAQGFINIGTFFAGADYAARHATDGYVRALAYGSDPNAAVVDTITAGNHVKLTATPAAQAAISLLSLNLAGSGVSWPSTGDLTVPGIIKSGSGSQSTISGANLTTASNAELVIRTNTASDSLLISSNITGTTGGLTKSGAGTLTLSGVNTYTGTTRIQSGTLVMGASDLFGNTAALVIDNATLDAATFTDTLGTLDINTGNATINLGAGATLAFAASNGVSWTDNTSGTLNITGTFVSGSSLRFGTDNTGLTATQLGLIKATGWTNFGLNASGFLTATPSGGPGPVDHFVISAISSPQTVGTPITGITLTAQDSSNATATGFTGTVTFGGTGGFSGTSGTFTAGVLTGVTATPTISGSNLTFTVTDGASHNGNTTITTIQTQYQAWAGGAAFDADANGDSVKNGLAWLLGAANKDVNALDKLPVVSRNGGNLRLTFRCLKSANRGGVVLKVQSSNDLGASDPWTSHEAAVPDTDSTVNGVIFDTTDDGNFIQVIADIPGGAKLFARLNAVEP